ncbi:MAG TPA: recombinase family protein [Streptosporangiaceae bacterium]
MARVLGAARISHDTEESTSIERQTEQMDFMCKARGDQLVTVTVDADVSGAVSPFDREGLGPWFKPPLVNQWDVLMVAKLDRLSRSVRDFGDLLEWAKANGKAVVSIAESLDFSTAAGRMFAGILMQFAQFERERMSERRKEAADKAKLEGRFDGRKSPFGYRPDASKKLVKDDVYAPVARRMAQWRIAGRGYAWIARELNQGDAKPREADWWSDDLVSKILANPGLNGQIVRWETTSKVSAVRGLDGMPLRFTDDPILTDSEWSQLAQATHKRTVSQREGGFLLTGVAHCGTCGKPLYGSRRANGYEYYRCRSLSIKEISCGSPLIPRAELDAQVMEIINDRWGDRRMYERTVNPAMNHQGDIENVKAQIAALESETYTDPAEIKVSVRMIAKLEAELERLNTLPVQESEVQLNPTSLTVADYLRDAEDGNFLLRTWGIKVTSRREVTERKGEGETSSVVFLSSARHFDDATGLVMEATPIDHIPAYSVAGVLFFQEEGTVRMLSELERRTPRAMA